MNGKTLGAQIKKYRLANNLTLDGLAQAAGCSKSYLSQIENGLSSPSLAVLGTLASELNTSVASLLKETESDAKTSYHLPLEKRQTLQYPTGLISSQPLTMEVSKKKMQPLLTTVEPGGSSSIDSQLQHAPNSEEFVLVLKGKMEFVVDGEKIVLKEGDTLYFDGDLPHKWKNLTDETAQLLFVFSPPVW
ncbi:helix-turn-helix domain-containing protein [Desulforhopalus singaporensis]|uniref:Transcriptional regulator, XRE family with cupin sensor n=1 Tax=Desulforhopalus singaporensis TaxID=91360 RepID=A0A1H0SKH8_9BACT|nr:XRE family transcriptional regulator [Desulforhopalus singaporensis]SDP42029.1 transcriptional regulator, XRE family with cupin sensor [Desulforhopalus singaporensis]